MAQVRFSRLAVATGVAALSVVLFAGSALAAGNSGMGMGSGTAGGDVSHPSGGAAAGSPGAVMGPGDAGSHMSTPSGAIVAGSPSPSTGPGAAVGNVSPQSAATVAGNAGAVMGQGSGYSASHRFMMGFATLASMIGGVAGQPLDDEWHGANGDGIQMTTAGMMVWRKADNWTAFTNGSMTWVNGPYGLQERLNTERFPWEAQ